jgi:hypothetical protein
MARFTDKADAVNTFKAGTVKIELHDEFDEEAAQNVNPGDCYDKVVYVENTGTMDAYVRVKLTPECTRAEGNSGEGGLDILKVTFGVSGGNGLTPGVNWMLDGETC